MTDAASAIVRAYDLDAVDYVVHAPDLPESVRAGVRTLVDVPGPGARVLEIGSGGGRDAALMEELGLRVRRTDVTPGFVRLLREQGQVADDLTSADGPYDAVWASASLLHVARADLPTVLPTVLARLAAVTRPGGLLRVAVKEGDGDGWSTHGSIRSPRHFTYWRADVSVTRSPGKGSEQWLEVTAVRG